MLMAFLILLISRRQRESRKFYQYEILMGEENGPGIGEISLKKFKNMIKRFKLI